MGTEAAGPALSKAADGAASLGETQRLNVQCLLPIF